MDGGVNLDTIKTLAQAGADIFVAGSAIFGQDDYQATITAMRDLITRGRNAPTECGVLRAGQWVLA